jgi:protein-tyrosine-phosphatase
MAVGIARKVYGDRLYAESAGLAPSGKRVTYEAALVVRVLFSTDISGHKPRHVLDAEAGGFDFVIAMDFNVYQKLKNMDLVPDDRLFACDIEDPFGLGISSYEQAAKKILRRLDQFIRGRGIE